MYQVFLKRSAEKELDSAQNTIYERLKEKLISLESNPRPIGVKKLEGVDAYRLRAGDYRILYQIDDKEKKIEVLAIRPRKDVYRFPRNL